MTPSVDQQDYPLGPRLLDRHWGATAQAVTTPTTVVDVDLAKLGYRPEKLEGLAIVDVHTIAVVNDNDFGIEAIDDKKGDVGNGAPSRRVIIRLPE